MAIAHDDHGADAHCHQHLREVIAADALVAADEGPPLHDAERTRYLRGAELTEISGRRQEAHLEARGHEVVASLNGGPVRA